MFYSTTVEHKLLQQQRWPLSTHTQTVVNAVASRAAAHAHTHTRTHAQSSCVCQQSAAFQLSTHSSASPPQRPMPHRSKFTEYYSTLFSVLLYDPTNNGFYMAQYSMHNDARSARHHLPNNFTPQSTNAIHGLPPLHHAKKTVNVRFVELIARLQLLELIIFYITWRLPLYSFALEMQWLVVRILAKRHNSFTGHQCESPVRVRSQIFTRSRRLLIICETILCYRKYHSSSNLLGEFLIDFFGSIAIPKITRKRLSSTSRRKTSNEWAHARLHKHNAPGCRNLSYHGKCFYIVRLLQIRLNSLLVDTPVTISRRQSSQCSTSRSGNAVVGCRSQQWTRYVQPIDFFFGSVVSYT